MWGSSKGGAPGTSVPGIADSSSASPAGPVGSATSPTSGSTASGTVESPTSYGSEYVIYYGNCKNIQKAWTTFETSYHSATTDIAKQSATADAAAAIAVAAYDLSNHLLTSNWEHAAVESLTTDAENFTQDFMTVQKDLEAGDVAAADAAIANKLPADEHAIDVNCGPAS
ncbi:hypothetical protein ACFQ9X_21180 [Catenulispora yoronensis]